MITPKQQMQVNTAVRDYMAMFSDDYKNTLISISQQKANLDNEMAEVKTTHAVKRLLSTIPEKMYQMIQLKIGTENMAEFNSKASQRWFLTEWPQFKVTEHI